MASAFFILIRTEPINEGHGMGAQAILYSCHSPEAATRWGRNFAAKLILNDNPLQELKELKALPFHDSLLTEAGLEPIDWPSFAEEVDSKERYNSHLAETCSSMAFVPKAQVQDDWSQKIEEVKSKLPNPEQWNWDPQEWFHYVLYDDREAFIVRAMNMLFAPLVFTKHGPGHGESRVFVQTWETATAFSED